MSAAPDAAARPAVHPAVVAEVTAKLPSRLAKRLDKEPALADAWRWAQAGARWTIASEAETVTLEVGPDGALASIDHIGCTCLLTPRCLHVAAVLLRLRVADAPAPDAAPAPAPGTPPAPATAPATALEPAQREAAALALATLAELLAAGASALGAVGQGALLRALHEARIVGLHRLARGLARVVEQARLLRDRAPESSLDALVAALAEALAVATALATDAAPEPAWVGVARREFEPITGRRLYGLFVEPVLTATGYAGAVTWLADAEGRLYSVGDVLPGPPARAALAYRAGLGLAGIATPHHEIARTGLFVARARVSEDGRLGGGQDVAAAPASERADWSAPPLAGLWSAPDAASERWRFVDLRLLGPSEAGLAAEVVGAATRVTLIADSDHPELMFVDNLHVLARAPGHTLRCICRVFPERPHVLAPLAIATPEIVKELSGCANLGVDRLSPALFPALPPAEREALASAPPPEDPPRPPPLEPLRRRLARLALGGRATLPESLAPTIAQEARALAAAFLPTAAALLHELHAAALVHTRDLSGVRRLARPDLLARAWLRTWTYLDAVARHAPERWPGSGAPGMVPLTPGVPREAS